MASKKHPKAPATPPKAYKRQAAKSPSPRKPPSKSPPENPGRSRRKSASPTSSKPTPPAPASPSPKPTPSATANHSPSTPVNHSRDTTPVSDSASTGPVTQVPRSSSSRLPLPAFIQNAPDSPPAAQTNPLASLLTEDQIARLRPKWTDYIPHKPTSKQLAFLMLPHREALFGGAAGGGKSDALLMGALQYVDVPGYSAIIFRRTLTDLKLPNSLLDRAHAWLSGQPCTYVAGEHTYYFPTKDFDGNPAEPAKLAFGYIGQEGIQERYQSAEFQYVAFDELTQHEKGNYTYMFSRCRRTSCPIHGVHIDPSCRRCHGSLSRVPLRVRSATNPGGRGHAWVRELFQIEKSDNPDSTYPYIGKDPNRPFIPSFIRDNPHLDQESYEANLEHLDPLTRARLRDGDWGVSSDSKFRPDWFRRYSRNGDYWILGPDRNGKAYRINEMQRVFCTVDTAASSKEGIGDKDRWRNIGESWTVICVWVLTPDYNLLLASVIRFRKEIPDIIHEMRRVQQEWNPQSWVMEAVGTGKGAFQLALRSGFAVTPYHPHVDKIVRASDAMVRAEQGKIWLPQYPGPNWLSKWEQEVFVWSGAINETDDQVDCLSMACQHTAWEAANATNGGSALPSAVPAHLGAISNEASGDLPSSVGHFTPNVFYNDMYGAGYHVY